MTRLLSILVAISLAAHTAAAQDKPPVLDGRDGRQLLLENFRPQSMLRLTPQQPQRAKFPVVDVHMHPRIRLRHNVEQLDDYVRLMDDQNIAMSVSLDATLGPIFDEHLDYVWKKHRDRFVVFANVNWQGQGKPDDPSSWDCHRPEFARRTVEQLAAAHARGVTGLKVFKDFGLVYRNPDGSFIKIDDPRWDPIWAECGRLGMPIIIHVADPAAFFLPIDEKNERWEELHRHPEWSFYGPQFPRRDELFAAFLRVVKRHPQTTFIGAHLLDPEDLNRVAGWLDEHPNLVLEIASRIAELGRQPYTARRFILRYQDRLMFGTDGPRVRDRLLPHWRFLETWDENFAYAENPFPPQGLWNIYGIGLPDDVLRKLYSENATRIVPGVKEKLKAVSGKQKVGG
ncbi:MAG: amidohydrolase [Planctomycetaceae bacterium]|nr:amidohydrolase [Planctomycetaceae bacterium]